MRKQDTRSVLIFGGAGFIGSNLAHSLLSHTDAKVHIFDNLSRAGVHHNVEWLRKTAGNSGRLQVTVGDVRDAGRWKKPWPMRMRFIILPRRSRSPRPWPIPGMILKSILPAHSMFWTLRAESGKRPFILFTSTNKVYGELGLGAPVISGKRYVTPDAQGVSESQPLDFHSPYGCSKGAADQYVRDFGRIYGMPTVVFRMSCVAGPRQFGTEDQGWVAHFVYSALQEEPVVIYGDGRQVRDVLCVDDLLRAFEAARQNIETTRTEVYNVGGGPQNSVSLLELMDEIDLLTGRRMECVLNERRVGDQLVYITDNSKIQHDTGWKPEIGLRKTFVFCSEFWEQNHGAGSSAVALWPRLACHHLRLAAEFSGRAG